MKVFYFVLLMSCGLERKGVNSQCETSLGTPIDTEHLESYNFCVSDCIQQCRSMPKFNDYEKKEYVSVCIRHYCGDHQYSPDQEPDEEICRNTLGRPLVEPDKNYDKCVASCDRRCHRESRYKTVKESHDILRYCILERCGNYPYGGKEAEENCQNPLPPPEAGGNEIGSDYLPCVHVCEQSCITNHSLQNKDDRVDFVEKCILKKCGAYHYPGVAVPPRREKAVQMCALKMWWFEPNVTDCSITCRDICVEDLINLGYGEFEQDLIITEKHLCDLRCYGGATSYTSPDEGTTYTDGIIVGDDKDCHGYCHTRTCKGYMSLLMYCDCHFCCEKKEDGLQRQYCAINCYEYFEKQWNPWLYCIHADHVTKVASTYCMDTCTLELNKATYMGKITNVSMDICNKICRIYHKEGWDFKDYGSAHWPNYKIVHIDDSGSRYIIKQAVILSYDVVLSNEDVTFSDQTALAKDTKIYSSRVVNEGKTTVVSRFKASFSYEERTEVEFSDAIPNLESLGVDVSMDESFDRDPDLNTLIAAFFPFSITPAGSKAVGANIVTESGVRAKVEGKIEMELRKKYSKTGDGVDDSMYEETSREETSNTKSTRRDILTVDYEHEVPVAPCTLAVVNGFVTMLNNLQYKYGVLIKLEGWHDKVNLTADDIKRLVESEPSLNNMRYIEPLDEFAVAYMVVGNVTANQGSFSYFKVQNQDIKCSSTISGRADFYGRKALHGAAFVSDDCVCDNCVQ